VIWVMEIYINLGYTSMDTDIYLNHNLFIIAIVFYCEVERIDAQGHIFHKKVDR
jgi:hypothetical protein